MVHIMSYDSIAVGLCAFVNPQCTHVDGNIVNHGEYFSSMFFGEGVRQEPKGAGLKLTMPSS